MEIAENLAGAIESVSQARQSYYSLIMLALTLILVLGGLIAGRSRGRNHSIIRFIIVLACLIFSLFACEPVKNYLMDIEFNGVQLRNVFQFFFNEGTLSVPDSIANVLVILLEILVKIICYFICFLLSMILSWLLVFPILKAIVKKEKKKDKTTGTILGLFQGVIVLLAVIIPVNGLIVEVNKISTIELNGAKVIEIPEEYGLEEISNSDICKFTQKIGGWYFDIIATSSDTKLSDICDTVVGVAGLADSFTQIGDSFNKLTDENATTAEKAGALKNAGEAIIQKAKDLENMGEGSKEIINEVISDVKGLVSDTIGGLDEEQEEFFDNLDLENMDLGSMGQTLVGIGSIVEKSEDPEATIEKEDFENVVAGFAENPNFIDMIPESESSLVEVNSEEELAMYQEVINSKDNLTEEQKNKLLSLVGVKVPGTQPEDPQPAE